jgi:hypothetical protein
MEEIVTINEWINNNIKEIGAKNLYDNINNAWDRYSDNIKEILLNEIYKNIKPEKIETIEDLAKLLNKNEYRNELYNEYNINVEQLCKENGWVIIFGQSDDLIEFRGFVDLEDGAWDGTLMKFVKPGDFYLDKSDSYDDEEIYRKSKEFSFIPIDENDLNEIKKSNYANECIIEMLWCPNDSTASWQVNVQGAPSINFIIMEDDEAYCEAVIVDLSKFIK